MYCPVLVLDTIILYRRLIRILSSHPLIRIRQRPVFKPMDIKFLHPALLLQISNSILNPRHATLLGMRIFHRQRNFAEKTLKLRLRYPVRHISNDDTPNELSSKSRVGIGLGTEPPVHSRVLHSKRDGVNVTCVGGIKYMAVLSLARLGHDEDTPVVGFVAKRSPGVSLRKVVSVVQSHRHQVGHCFA